MRRRALCAVWLRFVRCLRLYFSVRPGRAHGVRSGCPRSGSGKRYNRNLNGSVCRTVYKNKLETLTLRLWGALCAVSVLARRLCAAGAVSSMSVYADPVHEALSALGGKTNWYARAELLQGLHAHGAGFVTDVVLKSNLAKPPFKSLDEHYNPLGV